MPIYYALNMTSSDCVAHLARYRALRTERLSLLTGDSWRDLEAQRLLVTLHTDYGAVVTFTARGRSAFADLEPAYLAGPTSVATAAFQAEAEMHLRTLGFTINFATYKRATHFNPHASHATTQQILCFRVTPPGYTPAVPGDPDRYPLLYTSLGDTSGGMHTVRRLAKRHSIDMIRHGHPMYIAVPQMTRELIQGMPPFQKRQRKEGRLTPELLLIPPVETTTPR